MKKHLMVTSLITACFVCSLLYSCMKEGLTQDHNTAIAPSGRNAEIPSSYRDSGCSICSEHKTAVLTPANFFGPYTGPGVELNSKTGSGTISDIDIQHYKEIDVSVIDLNGRETAIPYFNMAADGSYESISYKRGSSYLMILYVRFNKSTNTFTYKPVNNLEVRYRLTFIS